MPGTTVVLYIKVDPVAQSHLDHLVQLIWLGGGRFVNTKRTSYKLIHTKDGDLGAILYETYTPQFLKNVLPFLVIRIIEQLREQDPTIVLERHMVKFSVLP